MKSRTILAGLTCLLALNAQAASRILETRTPMPSKPSLSLAAPQLKAGDEYCDITIKNKSYETVHFDVSYVDGGIDTVNLKPGKVRYIDMVNDRGDCDPGADIQVTTLDGITIFKSWVRTGKSVVIDPYQLKFLRR